MPLIGKGQAYKPGDHFIEHGDKRVYFATKEARDEAHTFMEGVAKSERALGERLMANQLADMRQVLRDHIENCESVVAELNK